MALLQTDHHNALWLTGQLHSRAAIRIGQRIMHLRELLLAPIRLSWSAGESDRRGATSRHGGPWLRPRGSGARWRDSPIASCGTSASPVVDRIRVTAVRLALEHIPIWLNRAVLWILARSPVVFGKPVSTPDQVRGRLFPGLALACRGKPRHRTLEHRASVVRLCQKTRI